MIGSGFLKDCECENREQSLFFAGFYHLGALLRAKWP